MTVKAGHCTECGTQIFRFAVAQRDDPQQGINAGSQHPLWPNPNSVYARLETPEGYAPGIGFCHEHVPPVGQTVLPGFGPVMGIDFARSRYSYRFRPEFGITLKAWLRDAMSLEDTQIDRFLEQWQADRG